MVEMKEGPHDLCLTVLHTFLLSAKIKIGVVLSFLGRHFLDYFQLGFLAS